MFAVESYAAVRRFVFVEGNSQREAAKVFGLSRDTLFVASKRTEDFDFHAIVRKIKALPAPETPEHWAGSSMPNHEAFVSPQVATPQDKRRAKAISAASTIRWQGAASSRCWIILNCCSISCDLAARCRGSSFAPASGLHRRSILMSPVSPTPDGALPARSADFVEGPSWYLDPSLGGLIED